MSGIQESRYSHLYDATTYLDQIELIYLNQYKKAYDIYTLPGTKPLWGYCQANRVMLPEVKMLKRELRKLNNALTEIIHEIESAKNSLVPSNN